MMMEAARTSETSVDNYFTRQYIPEDKSELHTRCRDNFKSHLILIILIVLDLLFVKLSAVHTGKSCPDDELTHSVLVTFD
jgi:hypothetical protein